VSGLSPTIPLLAICDSRFVNAEDPAPPMKFKLPDINLLLFKNSQPVFGEFCFSLPVAPLGFPVMQFSLIDIGNAFHSCKLPGVWPHVFVAGVLNDNGSIEKFYWKALGFGWNKSPVILKNKTDAVLSLCHFPPDVEVLKYFDDFLVAAENPADVCLGRDSVIAGLRPDT